MYALWLNLIQMELVIKLYLQPIPYKDHYKLNNH